MEYCIKKSYVFILIKLFISYVFRIRINHIKSTYELFKFKQDVDLFFDNVKVNDENHLIKKNRLELLNLLCKNFDNFFNFSKIEG